MQADFLLEYDTIPLNEPTRFYLMARFVSDPVPQDHKRRPLNLSLVIDRSGSMGGAKIDFTRQAAQFLVQNLSAQDTLSIVLYNDVVETLLVPERVRRKDIINQRIGAIKPRGTTNLSGGWLEGCNLVAQNIDEEHLNRVILMSDGLANRGVTSAEQLVRMAHQKYQEKISTTTMGLGTDFNEDLLQEMASAGGGAYYFIESPEVAPLIFKEELQGLLNVVGQNLTITVEPTASIEYIKQLNAYPMDTDGRSTSFRLGDIFGDEVKALLLELSLRPQSQTGEKQVGTFRFEYDELVDEGSRHRVIEVPLTIQVGVVDDSQRQLANPQVKQSVLLLQAAQARKRAIKAADKGEFETAAQSLRSAADAIKSSNINDPQLLEEQTALIEQADEIEKGSDRYGMYDRKTMSTQAFYTMTSRHEDTQMLRIRERERQSEKVSQPHIQLPEKEKRKGSNPEDYEVAFERREGVPPTHVTWKQQTFALDGELIRIGRSKHNEIILLASGVSRFHCQVKRMGSHMLIEDVGSTNGTMMKGMLLTQPQLLSVGDVVYVCDEKLVFHDGSYES